MHATLGYLMFDGPGDPQLHLKICVFVPAVSVAISWILFWWKAPTWLSTALATIASLLVLSLISHQLTRDAMIADFGIEYVVAIVTSASLPLAAVAHFRLLRKRYPLSERSSAP